MNNLKLVKTKLGKAVYANKKFEKGEEIIEFKGELIEYDNLPKKVDHYIQIGKTLNMGPSGDFDDFINHSCNPNCGLIVNDTKVTLIAITQIRKDEEISFDYSTTMDEDDWEMDCLCEDKECRKRIRDFKYLPKEVQDKYIKLGIVPKFIIESIKR